MLSFALQLDTPVITFQKRGTYTIHRAVCIAIKPVTTFQKGGTYNLRVSTNAQDYPVTTFKW